MKYSIYIFVVLLSTVNLTRADSELIGKIDNNSGICTVFYDNDRYIDFPEGVFVRSHFKSKISTFDANNDGNNDHLKLKENFTTYQTNMMYFAYENSSAISSDRYKFIFPQSWMKCKKNSPECNLDRKIKSGILEVGLVPGKDDPVYYRSRYTNVFPFIRNGSTYYKVTTESFNKDVVSIVKPTPNINKFELICAFRTGKKL
ncbi:MAG: hypothetical protein KUG78_20845 [Kangiellaceae bacterium]|nr:hypothetical protein [Kangiellaceae bacterium]